MYAKKGILSKIPTQSILIGILHLIGLLSLYRDDDKKRGRPYVYPTCTMIRCYIVRIWMRIPSNNCLHQYFSVDTKYNRKVMRACGLDTLPDRRTFDRRFKMLPLQHIIDTIGTRFLAEYLSDVSIVSVDSSMVRAKNGHIWHRKHMISGTVPRHGIDTDARWGFASTKGWQFGYKMRVVCSAGPLPVPVSACISTANVQDNQIYCQLTEHLPSTIRYVVADEGYDDWKLYDYSRQRGMRLVFPMRRYRHTKGERLKMLSFYKSGKGQRIYRTRSVSIEPLFECIKDTFGVSTVPVIGFSNVSSYLLMCILVYQITVYYNCIVGKDNPRCIKWMLGN